MMGRSALRLGVGGILWDRHGMACRRFGLRKRGVCPEPWPVLGDRLGGQASKLARGRR